MNRTARLLLQEISSKSFSVEEKGLKGLVNFNRATEISIKKGSFAC